MPARAESRLSKLPRSILRRKSYLGTPCWGTILTRARKGLYRSPCSHAHLPLVAAEPWPCNEHQHSTAQHSTAQQSTAKHSKAKQGQAKQSFDQQDIFTAGSSQHERLQKWQQSSIFCRQQLLSMVAKARLQQKLGKLLQAQMNRSTHETVATHE